MVKKVEVKFSGSNIKLKINLPFNIFEELTVRKGKNKTWDEFFNEMIEAYLKGSIGSVDEELKKKIEDLEEQIKVLKEENEELEKENKELKQKLKVSTEKQQETPTESFEEKLIVETPEGNREVGILKVEGNKLTFNPIVPLEVKHKNFFNKLFKQMGVNFIIGESEGYITNIIVEDVKNQTIVKRIRGAIQYAYKK